MVWLNKNAEKSVTNLHRPTQLSSSRKNIFVTLFTGTGFNIYFPNLKSKVHDQILRSGNYIFNRRNK